MNVDSVRSVCCGMTAPPITPPELTVHLVSGKVAVVQTPAEKEWYDATKGAYLEQLKFTENTDMVDLDRLLIFELTVYRWTVWQMAGVDYHGDMINDKQVSADLKSYSDQINKIKESMGLNKKSRDQAANEGDFSAWITDLKQRAKIFGVHRENQLTKALTLMNEISATIGMFDRSDEEERRKLGVDTYKEVVGVIRDLLPEYHEIDVHFRKNEQSYWIRDQ